jgi:hypothetical protein
MNKLVLITLKKEQEEIPKEYLDQMVLTESNYKTAILSKIIGKRKLMKRSQTRITYKYFNEDN